MKTHARTLLALLSAAMLPACGSSGDTIIVQSASPGPFDGTVAFVADWIGDGRGEAYAGEIAGTRVIPAGPPVDATREIRDLRYSPDRKWISYRLDRTTPGNFTLMVVPADGGVAQDRTLSTTTTVDNYAWSPDSTMIAFIRSGGGLPAVDLWVVTAFGAPIMTNLSDGVAGGLVDATYAWSPDSQYVAYQGDMDVVGEVECFVAKADGTSKNQVHPPLPPGSDGAGLPKWSSDSSRVAYVAEQDSTTSTELYTSLPDGTGNAKINGTLTTGNVAEYAWAPDGSRIVYRARQDSATQFEIYTSLPNGTGNVKISGSLVATTNAISPSWAPDSSRVAYFAMQGTDTAPEMYTSLPTGTAGNVKVSAPRGVGGDLLSSAVWAPNGSRIAYRVSQSVAGPYELHTVSPTGTSDVKVSGAEIVNSGPLWSPDSSRLVYRAVVAGKHSIFATQAASLSAVQVSGTELSGFNPVGKFDWSADSSRIVYISDEDFALVDELYSALPDGSGRLRISGLSLAIGGTLSDFVTR